MTAAPKPKPPAKTNAERQREFRARRAAQQSFEVRGIFAHHDDHAAIKEAAVKLSRRRARIKRDKSKRGNAKA